MKTFPTIPITLAPEIEAAVSDGQPVVALETTVISHGLPYPDNLTLAREMEQIIRDNSAIPATIAIIKGVPKVGLTTDELTQLADGGVEVRKISRRDFGPAIAQKAYGATTVAGTMIIAHRAGIQVFATGGIGGVHRGTAGDVSADLIELSQTPVVVVCAGAKSILDLPRTLEWLETFGVPVLGYQTEEFPAFYTATSGLPLPHSAETPTQAAQTIAAQWGMGLQSGILLTVPIPASAALDQQHIDAKIEQALREAAAQSITGQAVTPYLLQRLIDITGGESLAANLALLRNNAQIAAQVAVVLTREQTT